MQIERFEVKGFKNLRQSVVLDHLAGVNVIHGENNVGKSNLLQAMDLFFWLLGQLGHATFLTDSKTRRADGGWVDADQPGWLMFMFGVSPLHQQGFVADELFNAYEPSPVEWNVSFKILSEDFERAGAPGDDVAVIYQVRLKMARHPGGDLDVGVEESAATQERWTARRALFLLIANDFSIQQKSSALAFILVDTHRRIARVERTEHQSDLRRTVPSSLLLALYDAKESLEPGVFQRWELFEKSMNSLGRLVDDGRFMITYDRRDSRAVLSLQKGRIRMPIESLGSGIRQMASLLARVLLGNSAIVAVEEPELNLRYDLQLKLRDIFKDITDSGLGPKQIILTSHSPAFETGSCFYAMTRTPDGPKVTRRPIKEASAFTQHQIGLQPDEGSAAFGYVSSDGLLRLSEQTCKDLGVEGGGGVVVGKRAGQPYVEILTNEQFRHLMFGEGDGE